MRGLSHATPRRVLHRLIVFTIMVIASVISILESVSKIASKIILPVMRWLGLDKIEPWLKDQSVWFTLPILITAVGLFVAIDVVQYPLYVKGGYFLLRHNMLLGFACIFLGLFAHVAKWLPFFVANRFLRLFKDKLLAVWWIGYLYYTWYVWGRKLLMRWLKTKWWYRQFVATKAHVKMRFREKLAIARLRLAANKRRKTVKAALRLREQRVQRGQCI